MSVNDSNVVKITGREQFSMNQNIKANNITTVRSDALMSNHPSVRPSRTLAEARLKVFRVYTRFCRLVPFLIRIYGYNRLISPYQFKENVASAFRENSHLRRADAIDYKVNRAYSALHDMEQHYGDTHHFDIYVKPWTQADGRYGFSYLQEKQYGNRSGFLKDFYKGNRPNY